MKRIAIPVIEQPPSAYDEPTVVMLVASMGDIGQLQPVVVQNTVKGADAALRLVAGRNRMEAARRLGWIAIDAVTMPGLYDAKMPGTGDLAEIAENLHRRELGSHERDALIRRYADLVACGVQGFNRDATVAIESKRADGRGHRPQGIPAKVAADLGIGKRTVQRAMSAGGERVSQPVELSRPTRRKEVSLDELRTAWRKLYDLVEATGEPVKEALRKEIDERSRAYHEGGEMMPPFKEVWAFRSLRYPPGYEYELEHYERRVEACDRKARRAEERRLAKRAARRADSATLQ